MLLRGFCPQGSILGSQGLIPKLHPAPSLELRIHLWRCLPQLSTWISCRHYSSTSLNLNPSSSCIFILGVSISVSPSPWARDPGILPPSIFLTLSHSKLQTLHFRLRALPLLDVHMKRYESWVTMSYIYLCIYFPKKTEQRGGRGHAWFHCSLAAPYVCLHK